MYRDLFINFMILISFVSVINQIFFNTGLSEKSPLRYRVVAGMIWGVLGIALMTFSVRVNPNVLVDYRNFAMILAAVFGGFTTVTVTGIMMGFFRIFYYGLTNASLVANMMLICLTMLYGSISRGEIDLWKKWLLMVVANIGISCLSFAFLITDRRILTGLVANFSITSAVVGIFMFFYTTSLILHGKRYRKWKIEATKDYLTGLYNVRQFKKILNNAANQVLPFSLILIDVDYFKKINDSYGHTVGDHVLKVIGGILTATCRDSDQIFRIGGEELAVLLLGCGSVKAAEVAERIRSSIESHQFSTVQGVKIQVTVSIGVSTYPDKITDLDNLIESADKALYKAKRAGRNRVILAVE